jgi:hypothetical protein
VPVEVRRLLNDLAVDDMVNEDDLLRDGSAGGCEALSGRQGQFPIVLRDVTPFGDDTSLSPPSADQFSPRSTSCFSGRPAWARTAGACAPPKRITALSMTPSSSALITP